ncbi:nucleoside deaminase [Sinomonas notoginsengisoli]|uniref:nucleoside deaminase n=1 Tax=Sinomonas notoginsengisoli TaxID=1457311 RepID=UPI001F174D39|nr:nucleoside deaminase [Sinomonas notoginsengisoli]
MPESSQPTLPAVVERHLARAVELAVANVAEGGGPFGAVVGLPDGRTFEGQNRVTRDNDPTAHAEVVAIRAAAAAAGFDLTGAALYASCEPCPLCVSAALWARIGSVHYAADRQDAAAAGFDDAAFYEYFSTGAADAGASSLLPITRTVVPTQGRPFTAWTEFAGRAEY